MDSDAGNAAPESAVPNPSSETRIDDSGVQDERTSVGHDAPADVQPPNTVGTRFRPIRFHARGGLGEVYVGADLELDREVAIKCLRGTAGGALNLARFVREAAVTGHLEHPGIVPVYGLLKGVDGRPFYAMRFIRGETLHDAVKRFHSTNSEPRTQRSEVSGNHAQFESLEFRQLLQRFTAVCNTIGYAHSQGYIHRDLKPANVMLGEYGETLVVDWGLAKPTAELGDDRQEPQRNEADGQPGRGSEDTLSSAPRLPGSNAASRPEVGMANDSTPLTEAGLVVGTPAFMSPEQAEGHVDLGPASDIFSLGAMLYVILTGQPPYQGSMPGLMLEDARTARFAAPRRIRPDVPAPLEAICFKAMRLRPQDRYESAKALAADIDRWLGDEAVTAWNEPWTLRAGRWLRRHRALVAAAALVLVVSAGFFAALAVQANRARERSVAEEERTARESKRAKANLDRAVLAIDQTLNRLGDDRFKRIPHFDAERRKILTDSLALFEGLLDENATDPGVRLQTGRAAIAAGRIHRQLDDERAGQASFRRAITILETLVAEHPDMRPAAIALAQALEQQARALIEADERHPVDDEEVSFRLQSDARRGYAHQSGDTGRYTAQVRDEAAALCRRCIALWERIAGPEPNDLQARFALAEIHYHLAHLLVHTGQRAAGEDAFRKTHHHQSAMVGATPDNPENLALLGSIDLSEGAHFLRTGQWNEAETAYSRGTAAYETVVKSQPDRERWLVELGYGRHCMALMHQLAQRWSEADAGYRSAALVREPLARDHRDVTSYQFDLCRTQLNRGATLLSAGKPAEALPLFDDVLDRLAPLVRKTPADAQTRQFVAYAHRGRAETLNALERYAEALAAWDLALAFVSADDRDVFTIRRTIAQVRGGNPGAADTLEAIVNKPGVPPQILFEAACALAETSPDLHDRAVALLKRCAAAGHFRDPAVRKELERTPAMAEVRKRADVVEMMKAIGAT